MRIVANRALNLDFSEAPVRREFDATAVDRVAIIVDAVTQTYLLEMSLQRKVDA